MFQVFTGQKLLQIKHLQYKLPQHGSAHLKCNDSVICCGADLHRLDNGEKRVVCQASLRKNNETGQLASARACRSTAGDTSSNRESARLQRDASFLSFAPARRSRNVNEGGIALRFMLIACNGRLTDCLSAPANEYEAAKVANFAY